MPKVSVIIPAYNRERTIARAIESVYEQTFSDWELVVCDDGSTDGTVLAVEAFCRRDSRIRLVANQDRSGAGRARNKAAWASTGQYLAFLDSDDRWYPQKLDRQVTKLDSLNERWGACYCGARLHLINRNKIVESRPVLEGDILKELLRFKEPIWTPTFVVRSHVYRLLGGMDELMLRHQDIDFYRRIAQRYKIAVDPEVLADIYLYTNKRLDGEDVLAKMAMYERYYTCTRELLGPWEATRIWARQWLIASGSLFRARQYGAGIRLFLRAMATNPVQTPPEYARLFLNFLRSFQSLPDANGNVR